MLRHLRGDKVEDHDVVLPDAVEKLRPPQLKLEVIADSRDDLLVYLLVPICRIDQLLFHHSALPERILLHDIPDDPLVAGKDDDGFRKIHRIPLSIRQPAVVKDLQEFIQNARVRLFDLVKQDDGKRIVPDCVGELATRLVADIAGRRTQELLVGVALLILGHVKPQKAALIPEEVPGQRLGGFRLAGARRPGEEKDALGSVVRHAAARADDTALDHVEHLLQRMLLPQNMAEQILPKRLYRLGVDGLPLVFLDAIAVKVNHCRQLCHVVLSPVADGANPQEIRIGKALRDSHKAALQLGQCVGVLGIALHIRRKNPRREKLCQPVLRDKRHSALAVRGGN